jgi:hypothetical protein
MIIRSTIDSDCEGKMYYIHQSMGKKIKQYLPKYRTRLSEYDAEKLIEQLQKDSNVDNIYLYKIIYKDGRISLFANPNNPIGEIKCEED